jgi:tellurite methyltransferase
MTTDRSVEFFDQQFARQIRDHDFQLNPFEQLALPHLRGRVLDFGCGMGNLSLAAARRGCSVMALDASAAAIGHLRAVAAGESLDIDAAQVDLRRYAIDEDFDTIVSIGLLMFFDCATALASLAEIQSHVKPGGTAIVNVLVEGTTYLDMFDPAGHCLFARDELLRHFEGWTLLASEFADYPAPGGRIKSFATLISRKPGAMVAPRDQDGARRAAR